MRRFPGSRRNPQFGSAALAASLGDAGLAYEGLGEELGGRRRVSPASPNDGWRVAAFRGYADHMASRDFERGMERLERLATASTTAIMCAESSWRRCHRRLIADALLARGWQVVHIGPRGETESHEPPDFATIEGGLVTYATQPGIV